jgi:hypothetical protein
VIAEPGTAGHAPRRLAAPFFVAVGVAVASTLVAVMLWVTGFWTSPTEGDPGARILVSLRPVRATVPAGSTEVASGEHDSSYESKCPDNPGGRSGWSAVVVWTTFRSSRSSGALIFAVGQQLAAEGWAATAVIWDHNIWQFPPAAEWTTVLANGRHAFAATYQYPAGSGAATGSWYLGANAKPPGFALPGC